MPCIMQPAPSCSPRLYDIIMPGLDVIFWMKWYPIQTASAPMPVSSAKDLTEKCELA